LVGGHWSADVVWPGQEGSGVRLEKGSDNQHVVGGGVWQGAGVGGTASATAAVGNNAPRASRSAAAAFFARMDVRRRRWRGRRCYRAGGYESRCWTARLEGGGGRREASSSLRRTTTMDGIFPRHQRDRDGCGDAAVPSDRRRRRLRRGRGTTRRDATRGGGGATPRDKRQATTARQGATLRSSRHCGDARGLVIYY